MTDPLRDDGPTRAGQPRPRRTRPRPTAGPGTSPQASSATPAGDGAQLGRVRVYPQYTFPVRQSAVERVGLGLDQTITVTDWRKQGAQWAEGEARRQVAAALGEPTPDAPGGAWWMGRPTKDTYRWQPPKGTARGALPVDPDTVPGWKPEPAERAGVPHTPDPVQGPTFRSDGTPVTPQERAEIIAAAAEEGMPFVFSADELAAGDKVVSGADGTGTVEEVHAGGSVTVDHGRELKPGHPGTRRTRFLSTSLGHGAVRRAPQPAEAEEKLPPPVQQRRFDDRRAHHDLWRGTGDEPAAGYADHAGGCQVCTDFDRGGDGLGRRLRVRSGAAPTFLGGMADMVRHPAAEAVLDVAHTQLAAYSIPDDQTGVLDVHSLIGSLPALMAGIGGALQALAEGGLGEGPVHASVVEMLADFAGGFEEMAQRAGEVHTEWETNPHNAHDLRRAQGEIPRADLFNVPV